MSGWPPRTCRRAAELLRSLRDARFLAAAGAANFIAVPLVVATMFLGLPADQAVRIGVLLVLLCPCVDYGIVFSGLAGGSSRRLLAATPLLLLAQMALLPAFLYLCTQRRSQSLRRRILRS